MEYCDMFEESEKGSYTPGFFLMKLSFRFDTNKLHDLSTEELGTFTHEYMHFLQNTSTPFGLWQAMVYYQSISDFFSFVQRTKPNEIPVIGYHPSDETKRRIELEKEASGCRDFINIAEDQIININQDEVELYGMKIKRTSLGFKDNHGISHEITLGANIIKESMAAMMQEIIDSGSQLNHSTVPYCIVERLASQSAPQIKDDVKKLIVLCFISLHTLNPGNTLIDYLTYANNNPTKGVLEIYDHFITNSKVRKNNGEEFTVEQLSDDITKVCNKVLQKFLFGDNSERELKYLAEILNRVKISSGMIPILRMIIENDIDAELIQNAVNSCGTPIIWNELGNISIPSTIDDESRNEQPDMEIMALIAHQSFYKRMLDSRQFVCPMYPICHCFMKDNIKDECYELPWQGPECIMTVIGKSLGLQ